MIPQKPSVLVIIPARYASTRFPGKPLIDIHGKSMILRVCEQVQQVKNVSRIIVATDDDRIKAHVQSFGHEVMMTAEHHQSGTERCAEVTRNLPEKYDIVINVQGDEPFIAPELIQQVIDGFDPEIQIVTVVKKIEEIEVLHSPNVVKAIFSEDQQAIYFSRHPIPYQRDAPINEWLLFADYYKHIGIYGFTHAELLKVVDLPLSPLESAEKLEQLRWLYYGSKIKVVITEHESIGIDTSEDLNKILSINKLQDEHYNKA